MNGFYDNGSGFGPQAYGFQPTETELANMRNRNMQDSALQMWVMQNSIQTQMAKRAIIDPVMGGAARGADFLYHTRAGGMAQLGIGALASQGMLTNGNPLAMSFGLQQFAGRTGLTFMDGSLPGVAGVDRSFAGAGFMTNQVVRKTFKDLQASFWGGNGMSNNLSGLDMNQAGDLLSSLGARGALSGERALTMRVANTRDRLANFIDMQPDGSPEKEALRKVLKKVDNKGWGDKYDKTVQLALRDSLETDEDGNTRQRWNKRTRRMEQTKESKSYAKMVTEQILPNKTIVEEDKKFGANLKQIMKSTASLVTTIGDVMGSNDMESMLRMAETVAGKTIRTAKDADNVKVIVQRATSFARSQGLDPSQYLRDIGTGSQLVNSVLQQKLGVSSMVLATGIQRDAMEAGMSAFKSRGAREGFSAQEAADERAVGVVSRMQENPAVIAALGLMQDPNRLTDKDKTSMRGLLDSYRGAVSNSERQNIIGKINALSQRAVGAGAIEAVGGMGAVQGLLKKSDIADAAKDLEADQINSSVAGSLASRTLIGYSKADKDALGGAANAQRLLGAVKSSFTGADELKFRELMGGNRKGMEDFLKNHASVLVDAHGKNLSVDEMLKMTGVGDSADARKSSVFSAMSDTFGLFKEAKSIDTRGDREERAAKIFADDVSFGANEDERLGSKAFSFQEQLAKGLLSDGKGNMTERGGVLLSEGTKLVKKGAGYAISEQGVNDMLDAAGVKGSALLNKTKSKDIADLVGKLAAGDHSALGAFHEFFKGAGLQFTSFTDNGTETLKYSSKEAVQKAREENASAAKLATLHNVLNGITGFDANGKAQEDRPGTWGSEEKLKAIANAKPEDQQQKVIDFLGDDTFKQNVVQGLGSSDETTRRQSREKIAKLKEMGMNPQEVWTGQVQKLEEQIRQGLSHVKSGEEEDYRKGAGKSLYAQLDATNKALNAIGDNQEMRVNVIRVGYIHNENTPATSNNTDSAGGGGSTSSDTMTPLVAP